MALTMNMKTSRDAVALNREYDLSGGCAKRMDWTRFRIIHRSNPDQICYPVMGRNRCDCAAALLENTEQQDEA